MIRSQYAVTSLIVGAGYISTWARKMLPTWAHYCERHQLDLMVYLTPLDDSEWARNRKLNWQKCLILQTPEIVQYQQVVWLDADIAVNARHAPSVFDNCPVEKLGGVGFNALPSQLHLMTSSSQLTIHELERSFEEGSIRDLIIKQPGAHRGIAEAVESVKAFQRRKGLPFVTEGSINTGTMVLSPYYHAELFAKIYRTYEDVYAPISDQFAIPAEAYRAGIVHDIDSRFNVEVNGEISAKFPYLMFTGRELSDLLFLCLQTSFSTSFFLHFAAAQQRMEFFTPLIYDWKDFARLGPNFLPSISLKYGNFDPSAVAASYFGCLPHLNRIVPREPNLTDATVFRSFREPRVIFEHVLSEADRLFGFYRAELVRSLAKSYRWIDGRGATIAFPCSDVFERPVFLKFQIEVTFYDDGRVHSLEKMLGVTVFVNGYSYIDREMTSNSLQAPGPKETVFLYSGYCWAFPGDNEIQIVAPNWTAYSLAINNDPRTLSVALFGVHLRLIDFA